MMVRPFPPLFPSFYFVHKFDMYVISAVDAIIFLAPISGFDQVLSEDRTVNRLVSFLFFLVVFDSSLLARRSFGGFV